MKLFRFDVEVGHDIRQFDSAGSVISGVARLSGEAAARCIYLSPGGTLGYHQAAAQQLYLVVAGEGWVCDVTRDQVPIRAGQAAFWEAGEWHASGSSTGMTVMVLEGEKIDPEKLMPPV